MKITINLIIFILFSVFAAPSFAQEFFVYPSEGQSNEQTDKDKFECYNWAKGQTGFDPMQLPTASSPPPAQKDTRGSVVGGAALGAIVGQIADGKAGEGAAIGGLLGGARRSSTQRQNRAERQQWEQQQANQYAQARNSYNRAYVACLEARGYSVR